MRGLLLALLLTGCVKQPIFDLSIPDAPLPITSRSALDILTEASQAHTPSVRRRAIALGIETSTADRATWVGRGTFDPDGWVQAETVRAASPYA